MNAVGIPAHGPAILIARATSANAATAIEHHASRRWASIHASPLRASARAGAPLWHDVATKLRISLDDNDPSRCAEKIAAALSSRPLVAQLPAVNTWDRAVLEELARLEAPLLLLFTTSTGSSGRGDDAADLATQLNAQLFEVGGELDGEAQRRWFSAAADAAQTARSSDDLASLDAWWTSAERVVAERGADAQAIPENGKELFAALALISRAWPVAKISQLCSSDENALAALTDAGIVTNERGWIGLAPAWSAIAETAASQADSKLCARVADAILASFDDSWSLAVAADLLVRRNDLERAEATHALAVERSGDSLVRREVVDRWARSTAALPSTARLAQCIRAGARALDSGEADEAFRWAQSAASIGSNDSSVALLLGQAAVAMGDLLTGRVALEKARNDGASAAMQKLIAAELSEIAYASEDFETATKEAYSALDATAAETTRESATMRLKARNTLGKVLLARSQWQEAEEHFAEDVCYAVANGGRTAELRARLNRGIAILSSNRIEEAKAIFESVLRDGELLHEARACAFAHENLAVVAMWRHDYGDALHWFELAVKLRQRLNDKLKIVLNLGNLAQLRYKLGLFEHAEQAVLFGRRVLSPGMPQTNSARFSIEAARLALSRGRTAEAQREIARAITEGETAGYRIKMAGEAYRLAARIALEDGDLTRAREAIAKAEGFNGSDEAAAEIAVLKATVQRAAGTPDLRVAEEALILVRALGEEELLREIHVLLFELYRAAGDTDRALVHIDQAIGIREQVSRVLTGDTRDAFLARRDVAALDRLRSLVDSTAANSREITGEVSDVDLASFEAREEDSPRTSRGRASIAPQAPRELVGDDPSIRSLRAAIKKVARADSTVLVRGESGTGKELVAEALHRASDRASGPLVSVNCAALVETLLLSELFGHEKGAFTGAAARRRGRFELAEGGTLFLDEIGDISPRTQVALLRVLQERTFERVGGTTPIHANVRIVCATHRDLKAMVERGDFREDLYYRLRGITLEVPALRQRLGDLPRISETLLARIAVERSETPKTLSPAAIQLLSRHRWPGNVRELENALRAATLFAEGNVVSANDLIDNVEDLRPLGNTSGHVHPHQTASASRPTFSPMLTVMAAAPSTVTSIPTSDDSATLPIDDSSDDDAEMPLPNGEAGPTEVSYACVRQGTVSLSDLKRQIERDCIARALAETKGNITRAAALLGMKRPRLSQLVKQYGLSAVSEGQ